MKKKTKERLLIILINTVVTIMIIILVAAFSGCSSSGLDAYLVDRPIVVLNKAINKAPVGRGIGKQTYQFYITDHEYTTWVECSEQVYNRYKPGDTIKYVGVVWSVKDCKEIK